MVKNEELSFRLFVCTFVFVTLTSSQDTLNPNVGPNQLPTTEQPDHLAESIALAVGSRVICRDGWVPAMAQNFGKMASTPLCVKINSKPRSWQESRDFCRANNGFLLKMETRIKIGPLTLEQCMKDENIRAFWSGLHEEETKLVWDEFKPSLVHTFVGHHTGFGKIKRGWTWNKESFDNVEESCGLLTLDQTSKRSTRSVKLNDLEENLGLPDIDSPEFPQDGTTPFVFPQFQLPDFGMNDGSKRLKGDSQQSPKSRENALEGLPFTGRTAAPIVTIDPNSSEEDLQSDNSQSNDDVSIHKRSTMKKIDVSTAPPGSGSIDRTTQNTMNPKPLLSNTLTPNLQDITTVSTPAALNTEDQAPNSYVSIPVASVATEPPTQVANTLDMPTDGPRVTEIPKKDQTEGSKTANANNNEGVGGSVTTILPVSESENSGIVQYMNLNDCEDRFPSVCYSAPVRSLHRVSFCDLGWIGHPFLEKCYKVENFPLSHENAVRRCLSQGGNLATVDSSFYGNVTALAFLYDRRRFAHGGTQAWIDLTSRSQGTFNGGCPSLNDFSVKEVSCNSPLPSVCEKSPNIIAAPDVSRTQNDDSHGRKQILRMTSDRLGTIFCPLRTTAPEEVILWFKDGTLIRDPSSRRLNVYGQRNHQYLSRSLTLNRSLLRQLSSGHFMQTAMLQGNYWCEVWRMKPFRRDKSPKYLVIFNDVITLYGTIKTRGVPMQTALLFNNLDTSTGIPLTMTQDFSFLNDNITASLRKDDSSLRDVISFVKHVNAETGMVEFYTYLCLGRVVPETYKDGIVSKYLNELHSELMSFAFDIKRHWNMFLPITSAITITRTEFCPEVYLEDSEKGFGARFPKTPVNTTTESIDICDGVAAGYAYCKGNMETAAYWDTWQVDYDCTSQGDDRQSLSEISDFSNPTKQEGSEEQDLGPLDPRQPFFNPVPQKAFADLDEIEIENENVMDVIEKLAEIMDKTTDLTEADIDKVADVMGRIVEVNPSSEQVGDNLLRTVSRVLDARPSALMGAEAKNKAATKIISNIEQFGVMTDLGRNRSVRLVTPNLAMEMWDLDSEMNPIIGLGVTVADSWTIPLSTPRIVTITDRSDSELAGFDVAIELPQSLVLDLINAEKNSTRLSMIVYRKIGLFSSIHSAVNSSHGVVNSAVISASLGGKEIEGLSDMVRMVFRPFINTENHMKTTKCVYWDFQMHKGAGGWSTEGCRYNGTMFGKDVCLCDHLTNFAVLLDFYGHSKPIHPDHEFTLSIISLVGLSLSIFGLALTVITFIFFKKLRQGRAQQTLFNMAIALLLSKVVFLVGIKQTNSEYFCLSVAVLLHYFILVSFMWMLVEAVLQYLTFVKILGTYIPRYALKTSIPAWGLPLIPIITVLSIDYNLYRGRANYCWMEMKAFYYAFALPVGVIIIINFVMFIIIIISLVRRPDGLRSNQSKHRRAKMNLKAAVTIFVLLGLTWIFGYLAIEDARVVFQYIFTLFTSMQGFFIFTFLVARRRAVRDQWLVICCKNSEKVQTPKKVTPTLSNSTTSQASGSSLSNGDSTRTVPVSMNRSFDSVYYIPSRRNPAPYKAL